MIEMQDAQNNDDDENEWGDDWEDTVRFIEDIGETIEDAVEFVEGVFGK